VLSVISASNISYISLIGITWNIYLRKCHSGGPRKLGGDDADGTHQLLFYPDSTNLMGKSTENKGKYRSFSIRIEFIY
jgi:hypothetical protein